MIIPDTNAKGWPLWVLFDTVAKEIMRHEYKTEEEAKTDNKKLAEGSLKWQWILNDPSKA